MIHIDRTRAVPESLRGSAVEELRKLLISHYSVDERKRRQLRAKLDYSLLKYPDIRAALDEMFRGKCAYCEQPLDSPEWELHRPPKNARGFKVEASPEHYWWLAYEWENMYLSCPVCNRNKGTMFPTEADRVSADVKSGHFPTGRALRKELPFLLDPCIDYPEEYLVFLSTGEVEPAITRTSRRYDRALATIDILGLNRSELVERRAKLWPAKPWGLALERVNKVLRDLEPGRAFLQAKCWVVANWLTYYGVTIKSPRYPTLAKAREILPADEYENVPFFDDLLSGIRERGIICKAVVTAMAYLQGPARTERTKSRAKKSESVPEVSDAQIVSTAEHVRRVTIENFRAIERLDLKFESGFSKENLSAESGSEDSVPKQPWHVLLGANGIGKSSVLQAIGLTLLGKDGIEELNKQSPIKWSSLLRRVSKGEKQPTEGRVEISTSRSSTPITLTFTRDGYKHDSPEGYGRTYIRGYGPQRLIHRKNKDLPAAYMSAPIEIGNLFDPWVPLRDPQQWLMSIDNEADFDTAVLTLKDLLNLGDENTLERLGGRIWTSDSNGNPVSLDELSSGYQAVLTIAVDIMAGIYQSLQSSKQRLADMNSYGGIILLDELGAYLHPTWRKSVVKSLKRAFPGFQFLAMTHEPLCMWGLRREEVTVLRRIDGDLVAMSGNDLPSPRDMRVDQILTSHLFGMDSTIDERTEELFNRYYQLLAQPRPADPTENNAHQEEIRQLREQLQGVGVLGYTRRDQVLYEAIDIGLAKQDLETNAAERARMRSELVTEVRNIWKRSAMLYKELEKKR